jgi:LmbE family N-acetylglucosaminyl deacetylase
MDLTPARVLAIYAHPDDAEVSCGGTLASFAQRGAELKVVVVARGDKGASSYMPNRDELVETRRRETMAAGEMLGVREYSWLGLSDGDIENSEELRGQIVNLVRGFQPEVVIAPDPTAVFYGATYVNHPDHRAVGWAVLDAVPHMASNPNYYGGSGSWRVDMMLLSGSLEPDAWIDISSTIDAKAAALACHTSQLGEAGEYLRGVVRQRAEDEGKAAGVDLAEGFRILRFN